MWMILIPLFQSKNQHFWEFDKLTGGPRRIKRNLVGTGTSVRSPSRTASLSLMKADRGLSSSASSPTKILEASASLGI